MASSWLNSWGSSWGDSWGVIASITPAIDPGAGSGKGRARGKKPLPSYEKASELTDARQAVVDKILAERQAAEEAAALAKTMAVAPQEKRKPVLLAGGLPVPPVVPPAAVTLGDMIPELAALKSQLEAVDLTLEDERRRRLLLLS